MKNDTSWFSVLTLIAVAGISDAALAQDSGGYYSATICNKSDTLVSVAHAWRVYDSDEFRTLFGWRNIDVDECETLLEGNFGKYSNAIIYYYAEATDGGYWDGNSALKLCVPNTRFRRELDGQYECKRGERLVSFGKKEIKPDNPEYVLDLR